MPLTPSSTETTTATITTAPSPSRTAGRVRGWTLASATTLMGLIAGFFYAYACSVMIGLARVDDRTFIDSMQWINATVRNVWFAPAFFGALLVTAVAAALHLGRAQRPVLGWVVAALVLYGAAFGITMGVNVPLNEQLAAAGDPASLADPAAARASYEGVWTAWNTTRTVASTAALACLVRALMLHGRHTARPER
ncbi:DUF1772 domain-containing protein [Planobispora longispora]|uniref:Membrane protein n=1 Tax=Planobispora longispora TaxID=28887 RepID=A0A8J3RJS4_9ACTN|nr:anthrone oxygenase family protein [Planobispora longispora]GIH75955.1 membrane protein [Planobispora longispora]